MLFYLCIETAEGPMLPDRICEPSVRSMCPNAASSCRLRHSQVPYQWQVVWIFTYESSYCFQHVLAIAILSVCPSIRHTGGSVKNGASYDHQIFIVGCLEDSSFRNHKAFP